MKPKRGNPAAQYNLGVMYYKGIGKPHSYDMAVKWFQLAAEQGHADAQYNVAVMYHRGEGVREDKETAIKWYLLAAGHGDPEARKQIKKIEKNTTDLPPSNSKLQSLISNDEMLALPRDDSWTHKVIGEVDPLAVAKEWVDIRSKMTMINHGTGAYSYVNGTPCSDAYEKAGDDEIEKELAIEKARMGVGLLEEYAPSGAKGVFELVPSDNTIIGQLIILFNMIGCSNLCIDPKSCYGFHRDRIDTIHIPLETNDGCYLVFRNSNQGIRTLEMEVGKVYLLNTSQNDHTFFNGGTMKRYHLVATSQARALPQIRNLLTTIEEGAY